MNVRPAAFIRAIAVVLCCCAVASTAPDASAQAPDRAIEFDDLGFTGRAEVGARAAAQGAFAATVADATALVLNSAGLARTKRLHGAIVLSHERSRFDLDYGGGPGGSEVGTSSLQFAGAALPIPVLRGSLVPAISVHRAFSSVRDMVYSRDNIRDGRRENYSLQQRGATYAYSLGVGTDLSPALSAGLSVFLLDGRIDGLHQSDWQPLVTNPSTRTFVLEDVESAVSGYGARVGAMLYLHERARIGFQFSSPTVINVSSVRLREETRQVDNNVGLFTREHGDARTEYILPYRVDGAVAVPVHAFLFSAQMSYANWRESGIDGRRILTQRGDFVLDRVVSLSAGVEWTVPWLPLRVRAGYERAPSPLKYLQTDRVENDSLARVRTQSGRTRVSAGAGVLVWRSIVVDAAFTLTSGTRESELLRDELRASSLSLAGSYWF